MERREIGESEASTMRLPPQQEFIRAKCFHPRGTFVEFPKDDVETSIPARFQKIVRADPDRLAIKTPEDELTYDELNSAANRVAHGLHRPRKT